MEKDVTRRAVERALRIVEATKVELRKQIFTGPSQIRLTPTELQKRLASGNSRLLRHAVDLLDDEQLARMIAGATKDASA